jgi:diguanylate cyclase (GGDEF)-like protein
MLDIDHFHSINERFGAAAGDMVIGTAGQAFGRLVRDGDVAARLSGDEFAFFLPDAGIDEAMALAERIRLEASGLVIECRKADAGISESLGLSVSIGAAASPRHADGPESLMAAADKALFQAKAAGRNCVVAAG